MEGRAALSVGVANRVRVGNERGSDGGEGRVADGAVKDALAAGVRDGEHWRRRRVPGGGGGVRRREHGQAQRRWLERLGIGQ